MTEFSSIPDPHVWAVKGIKYIEQICSEGELRTVDGFKHQYDISNTHLFRYLQLRHAFSTQFGNQLVVLYASALINLLRDDTLGKPLSTIYKELLSSLNTGLETLKNKCLTNFPALDDEDCHISLYAKDGLHLNGSGSAVLGGEVYGNAGGVFIVGFGGERTRL